MELEDVLLLHVGAFLRTQPWRLCKSKKNKKMLTIHEERKGETEGGDVKKEDSKIFRLRPKISIFQTTMVR